MSAEPVQIDATIQLSLGRFAVSLSSQDSIRAAKKKIRFALPEVAHVNLNLFHLNYNGTYLSDESKTVEAYGITNGAVLHFIKKATCPAAALDTEKKADE